jgi:hypothetical protein
MASAYMPLDQGVLDVQVRVLEQALHSPEYRFNAAARAVFEARLITLRLASIATEAPLAQARTLSARLAKQART